MNLWLEKLTSPILHKYLLTFLLVKGKMRCKGRRCGADLKREAFHRRITVPDILPDGNYVLSMLWFGGCNRDRHIGQFADYISCSFVRVRGGSKLRWKYQPFFDAGDMGAYERGGRCLTSASYPHQCEYGCSKRATWYGVPKLFERRNRAKGRRKPRELKRSDFRHVKKYALDVRKLIDGVYWKTPTSGRQLTNDTALRL